MYSRLLQRAVACSIVLSLGGCIAYEQPGPQYGYEQPRQYGYQEPAPQPYYAAPTPYYYAPAPYYVAPSVNFGFGFWGGGRDGHGGGGHRR